MFLFYIFICIIYISYGTSIDGYSNDTSEFEKSSNIKNDSISPKIQLAFGVMTYQKNGKSVQEVIIDFHRLMKQIYDHDDHLYILHIDIKSDNRLIEYINEYCNPKLNCFVIQSRNIAWAGLSTGEMMLALMQTALEYEQHKITAEYTNIHVPGLDWSHFILIGHESIPLVSLNYIVDYIASYPSDTNFMNCWKTSGYDFFGQWESNTYRLQEVVVDDFRGNLIDLNHVTWMFESIIKQLKHIIKGLVEKSTEDSSTMQHLNHLSDIQQFQIQTKREIPESFEFEFYKSIQLMVVSRDFVRQVFLFCWTSLCLIQHSYCMFTLPTFCIKSCRYASYSIEARRIIMYLTNVKTSDEMFLPTILQSSSKFSRTAKCDTTLHFTHWIRPGGSWHPEYLTIEHLPMLMNTTNINLFARKFHGNYVDLVSSRMLLFALGRLRMEHMSVYDPTKRDVPLFDRVVGENATELSRESVEDMSNADMHGKACKDSCEFTDSFAIPPHVPSCNWMVPLITEYICTHIVFNHSTPVEVMTGLQQLSFGFDPYLGNKTKYHLPRTLNESVSTSRVDWNEYCQYSHESIPETPTTFCTNNRTNINADSKINIEFNVNCTDIDTTIHTGYDDCLYLQYTQLMHQYQDMYVFKGVPISVYDILAALQVIRL